MPEGQNLSQKEQEKADKRANALRDNLKKRKAFMKETRTQTTNESKKNDDAKT